MPCPAKLIMADLASNPTQITGWKLQAKEDMAADFSGKSATVHKNAAAKIRELYAKIGELTVE